ncbi:Na+/H+ antiporter NhaC, partial [Escherichia coli]|nr:Na+/H+ antiporter NhaC [Escherichia coli]
GYNAILESISQKIAKTMPALLILISVGLLIGTWMIGGTIPLMIYYGLNLINPSMIYVTALLVTAVVSVCTGTSWGSAGTVGVAFMGVAI